MALRKLGRDSAHRKAMLRNLATSLIVTIKITSIFVTVFKLS